MSTNPVFSDEVFESVAPSHRGGASGGLDEKQAREVKGAAAIDMRNVEAKSEYVWGTETVPSVGEYSKAVVDSWSFSGLTPAQGALQMMHKNNEKAERRGKVLTMLESMGVEIPLRLIVAGGSSGSSTITISKPSAEVVDEIIVSGERSLDPAPIFLIPPTFRTSVPQMKGWSDDEIKAYLLSSDDGYAAYLRGGGVPVQSLDNMVAGAYHDSQNGVPYDVEHKYDGDGNNVPPPTPEVKHEEVKVEEEKVPTQIQIATFINAATAWTRLYLRSIPRIRDIIRYIIRRTDDYGTDDFDIDDGDILLEPVDWDWENNRPWRSGDVEKKVTVDELPTEEEIRSQKAADAEAARQAKAAEEARIEEILKRLKEREEIDEEDWETASEYDSEEEDWDTPSEYDDDDDGDPGGGGDPGDDFGDDPEDDDEKEEEEEGDRESAMRKCTKAMAQYIIMISIGLNATYPDHECFIRALSSKSEIKSKEKEIIEGINENLPEEDEDDDSDDDGEDVEDEPTGAPDRDVMGSLKRKINDYEISPVKKRARGLFHHYPDRRDDTDQLFLN